MESRSGRIVIDSSFYGGLQIMATLHEARLIQDSHKIGSPRPNAGEGLEGDTSLVDRLQKLCSG